MKPCLRERKPSLKYKFYDDYESEDSDPPPESDPTDEDINYCHDCDVLFEDIQCLYTHLLRHIKQPKVQIERLTITAERAPIRITFKGCGSGDFAIVQSPTGALSPLIKENVDRKDQQGPAGDSVSIGVRISGKTDDEYEEKYIIPDSDPVAGGSSTNYGVETKTEDEHVQEEEEEESAMSVSFSPNYASAEMMHNDDNSLESQLSSNKTSSDPGCGSNIPAAEPTPAPEPSATPDHLMPKIRIKPSGLLMAPERESPQGLTITEITEESGSGGQEQMVSNINTPPMNNNISSKGLDQFASVDTWSGGHSGLEDPLRLPDTIETDGNIISNLFTNNTDRAKDLGLTSSDSEFISLDGLSSDANRNNNNNNNAMAVYNANNSATQSGTQSLLPATVSNALVGLPMQQLAQQVSRLQQPQSSQQMHQQNVLINIQQFPQAPQQQPPQQQVPHMPQQQQQVQPYGMYHQYPPAPYQPQGYGQYGQPYPQPNLYYASAPPPPAYPTAPAQHMPPPTAPQQMQHHHQQQQQPPQSYLVQSAPQQQQQQQQPAILGTVNQQVQPYAQQQQQQQQPQGQQHQIGYIGAGGQQLQGQYNQQGTYGQPAVQRPPQPNQPAIQSQQGQQQPVGNRMPAPRAPGQASGPRMGSGPRLGPPTTGSRAPYTPRGGVGGRPPMNRGRGSTPMTSMRGRPRVLMNVQQNGVRPTGMPNQQGNSPVKRTSEQMAAIAAKRKRMEALATVKVEADDDEDDCEVVSVQQNERAPLPKIQSVQGAVPETHPDGGGVMHLSDSITLSVRQPPPPPPSPKAKNDAKQVANVLAARGITVTAAPKENKQPAAHADPVPINLNSSVYMIPNKNNTGKKEDNTPTVDLTDEVRVPAPKTIPPPPAAATTNGQASTASTVPPPQPFKCDQCPARYGTNIALVKHRQQTHKTCNQMDYGVPLIDLRQPGITSKLTNFGIYNYIPLPAANVSGMFALPVISMNAVRNNVNLSALGSSMLTLGPIRKIQKSGSGPGGTSNTQSPPRGRPPINIASPTKKL